MSIQEAVALLVPVCVQAADLHAKGVRLFIHPSCLTQTADGYTIAGALATRPPTNPKDGACLAPELQSAEPGGPRATVYAVGAMLYELVTGLSVGPSMRRPLELNPRLPFQLEVIVGKALVRDPAHRPDDLLALAQAIHHLAPSGTVPPPPPADESHLDHVGDFEVDVSMSMLPPMPVYKGAPPAAVPAAPRTDTATAGLTERKERLQRDTRPRYVVVKDGMDHGPFAAVELLQQIGVNTFTELDVLRDEIDGGEKPISDWEDFAPFAEHARRHRDIAAEKEAVVRVVKQESRSTQGKALAGAAVLLLFIAGGAVWYLSQRGTRTDVVEAKAETVTNVETEGAVKGGKKLQRGGGVIGSSGGVPQLGGGMSCEGAINAYQGDTIELGKKGQADITAGQYGRILNTGGYFAHCGIPSNMSVSICAAVQNGQAVGVSVSTSPNNPSKSQCVSSSVRRLSFPSHPKLDVTRTTFAAE